MIARIKGVLVDIEGGSAVVDVSGVGYEVSLPAHVLMQLPPLGETVEFSIRQIFREDGVSLYGFENKRQRRIFDLLLSVKGCGPKVVLSLLGTVGEDSMIAAIHADDARTLTKAPGVGARLAERIILETKDKILEEIVLQSGELAKPKPASVKKADELIDALLGLGYRRSEAEAAAAIAREESSTVEEQIVVALQSLRK